MPVRDLITSSEVKVLGTAKVSIATATTTYFDFGTPDNLNLASVTAGEPGALYVARQRILVVADLSTAGTTDTTAFTILDAPDSSGSIGSTAAAVTSVISGALAGGTGDQYLVASVKLQAGRPWLKIGVVRASGTTDTHVAQCTVLSVAPFGAL
jgi:hypothetical protein